MVHIWVEKEELSVRKGDSGLGEGSMTMNIRRV